MQKLIAIIALIAVLGSAAPAGDEVTSLPGWTANGG